MYQQTFFFQNFPPQPPFEKFMDPRMHYIHSVQSLAIKICKGENFVSLCNSYLDFVKGLILHSNKIYLFHFATEDIWLK